MDNLYWDCQCDCGNCVTILGTNLTQGYTKSCGCLHSEIISKLTFQDLTGQKFSKLTVIERAKEKEKNSGIVVFKCLCECGTICYVRASSLKNGTTKSCGCMRSAGEYEIRKILNFYKITFITEYTFSDLPKRRFDFAIFSDENKLCCLIEYDGKQHFQFIKTWHKTMEGFNASVQRDKEKDEYCKQNNIKLYRIKYDDDLETEMNKIITENNLL